MSLVITNNILALSAHNDMAAIHKNLAKAIEKTATGMQINSAGDDAAGLAVSEKMRAQTQGLDRAASNTQDGISLIQTAEGALSETHSILQRMRELALQAANDTLTADDRSYIQLEAGELKDKIDYIAETTQFNGKKLLNGDAAALWSSDKMETRALIRGGLQEADSYAQKSSFEANYNIDIQATAGQAQVQKSQIITPPLHEEEVPNDLLLNTVYEELPLVKNPEVLTITQGDGKQAAVTLYTNDTLYDIAKKINGAIAFGLGQSRYVDDSSQFCTVADGSPLTSESVYNAVLSDDEEEEVSYYATMLVRSAVAGRAGELTFSASEELLNTLGLNTIQEATENRFVVNITDAHTGEVVASNVRVTGNRLVGALNPNVDVEFDAMAGITAEWDEANKRFNYRTKDYSTTLHLSDNTTVIQVGANEGDNLAIHLGDMSAHALGLDEVNMTARETASRSITVIDNAMDRVSAQRAKLGVYQGRLEHTANNITTTGQNLTAAESRIRNADMAKAVIEFTKLQILNQSEMFVWSQANQNPENVLGLLR